MVGELLSPSRRTVMDLVFVKLILVNITNLFVKSSTGLFAVGGLKH